MKTGYQRIIDEKTKEITGKFTELNSLIRKFNAYTDAEVMLTTSFDEIIKNKKSLDEYRQKKAYIQKVKTELEETLNLDELEGYEEGLPRVAAFMRESTNLDAISEEAVLTIIDENTKIFDKAKRELAELKLKFVKGKERDIKNVKYDGDLEYEFGTNGDLKGEISGMLNDSLKRLICTSFINGIQKSNLTDYEADYNGKDYLIAYIYTLVYELGDIRSGSTVLVDFDDITVEVKKKQNGIGAHTIKGIKGIIANNSLKDALQLTDLEDFVFEGLELLKPEHVTFLEIYKGDLTNELLYKLLDDIVEDILDEAIENINVSHSTFL